MGNTPLILAALAKAAIPSLNIVRVGALAGSASDRTVVTTTAEGSNLEVRMPRTRAALTELELELRALAALTQPARERLPFAVANLLGQTRHPKGAAIYVLEHLEGSSPDLGRMNPAGTLAENIGEALGAIHNLPLSVVVDAHLPEYNPADIALKYVNELDRIAATGKVPAALLDRWQAALEDVSLFRYQPTVVHGSLDPDTVLSGLVDHAEVVVAVTNWSQLHIGDPAEDFAWIFGSGRQELIDAVMLSYNTRHPNQDETLRQRAQLYSELAIGRFLLSGVETGDEDIVEDMVAVLAELEKDLNEYALPPLGKVEAPIAPIFAASELELDAVGFETDLALDAEATDVAAADETLESGTQPTYESLATEPVELVEAQIAVDESEQLEVQDIEPVLAVESTLTEPIDVVDEEPAVDAAEPIDDKTRPIELPEKTDNELF
ncbi:MAG: hypothetical protein RL605_741 [Actinomycetota bacterium]|jgi:aminoglycoside phosphotransferase (APT) family kinase protein